MEDEKLYLIATEEVEGDKKDPALWAKVITLADGDQEKAKYQYIKLRVEYLIRQNKEYSYATKKTTTLNNSILSVGKINIKKDSSTKNYFKRHWNGEFSLPISYWVNGLLVLILFTLSNNIFFESDIIDAPPKVFFIIAILIWATAIVASIWLFGGIWRSADNYINQGKPRVWGNLAKTWVVIGLVRLAFDVATIGIPQVTEFTKLAIGEDPFGTYQLRILRDATEVEILGAITFGLTDDLSKILDNHPSIKTVHLNNIGGRVAEAYKLRDLIESRQLNTYTSSQCNSACTIAYAAGKKRLISDNGTLGFHQFSSPGLRPSDFAAEYELVKAHWISKGIDTDFANKAFLYPNDKLWTPTQNELIESGFVTERSHLGEMAISGFPDISIQGIEQQILSMPVFVALKEHSLEKYQLVKDHFINGIQQGKSVSEIRIEVYPTILTEFKSKLPHVKDSHLLITFTEVLLDQIRVLYESSPDLCYSYVAGSKDIDLKAYSLFSTELRQRELTLIASVLRSSFYTESIISEIDFLTIIEPVANQLYEKYGDSIAVLDNMELAKANKDLYCQVTFDIYYAILGLTETNSSLALRYMFSG